MIEVTSTEKPCSICGCEHEVRHINITTIAGGHTELNMCSICRAELATRIDCVDNRCGECYLGVK